MRKLSLTRSRSSYRDEDFLKLISVDEYEYPIETKLIRRHSTVLAMLLAEYGDSSGKQEVEIRRDDSGTAAVASEGDIPQSDTTSLSIDGIVDKKDVVNTKNSPHSFFEHDTQSQSTSTLGSVASRIRHKCTPLALQRSSFSGSGGKNGNEQGVYAHSNTSTGSVMHRSTSTPTPSPPASQALKGDSPPSAPYTYPHALAKTRHTRHSSPRMPGFGQSMTLAAGSHEIVNRPKPQIFSDSSGDRSSNYSASVDSTSTSFDTAATTPSSNANTNNNAAPTALPGLAEAVDPAQNTKGALKPSPSVRGTYAGKNGNGISDANSPFVAAFDDCVRGDVQRSGADYHVSGSVNNAKPTSIASPTGIASPTNLSTSMHRKPSLISISSEKSNLSANTARTAHTSHTAHGTHTNTSSRLIYSRHKGKIWLRESGEVISAWVNVIKGVNNGWTPTETLSRSSPDLLSKLLACVVKYDDMATLAFIEEYLTDFTTPLNSLRHLLLAKQYNLHSLHGAAIVKVPPCTLPALTPAQIDALGGDDLHTLLNGSQTSNLLQLLEYKRLLISPSTLAALVDARCLAFKLRSHDQHYLTIDVHPSDKTV